MEMYRCAPGVMRRCPDIDRCGHCDGTYAKDSECERDNEKYLGETLRQELATYRAIGTISEFQALKDEKQRQASCMHCPIPEGMTDEEVADALRRTAEYDKAREEGCLVILPPPAKEGDPKPDCFEDYADSLWCLGYQHSEGDDEPTDRCKRCWYCESGDYVDGDSRVAKGGGEGE